MNTHQLKFSPKKSMAAFALLLMAFGGTPTWAADRVVFKDVSLQHHFTLVGKALVGMKIVQGYPDGRFRGERVISRYESAQILANLVTYLEIVYENSH